jgi:peptide/nickel transport system permease protein
MSALDVLVEDPARGGAAPSADTEPEAVYRRRRVGGGFWASAAWLALLIGSALLADLLPLKSPQQTFRGVARNGPSATHWFGADNIGHDVFSRTIYGARRSLAVAATATGLGLVVGATVGLISGYYRRSLDTAMQAVLNILLAIPGLVLLLTLIAFLAPPGEASPARQTFWTTIALSILTVPTIARVTRALTMAWGDRDFVVAARTLGARNKRIMLREILPNVVPTLVSFAFTLVAVLIVVEAALAFFGVGDVSGVSWGIMIQNGRSELDRSPHMVLFPAVFMSLTIISLNMVGDQLHARFNVRESGV